MSRASTGRQGEEGATLLLVLVFLTVFGVLIGVVLGAVDANIKTTTVVRSRAERTYVADAAIEYGIKRLAIDPLLCPAGLLTTRLPLQSLNDKEATLECEVDASKSDPPLGASGWTAIINGSLTKAGDGTAIISGPSYVGGTISGSGGQIENQHGSVSQRTCPAGGQPDILTVTPSPPHGWQCPTEPAPDPPDLVLPPAVLAHKAPVIDGACKVFFPGKYTDVPELSADDENYFVSGVYYFEDIGTWSIDDNEIIKAGTDPLDPLKPEPADCPDNADTIRGGGGTGYGAQWIFGGDSSISLGDGVSFEIRSRVPVETDLTPSVSLVAVPPDTVGYVESEPTDDTVLAATGEHPDFAIGGLFYGPTVDVTLAGPDSMNLFRNGVVADDVDIDLTSSGDPNPLLSATSPTNKRFARLTATATSPRDRSEQPIVASALVEIRNTTNPATVVVHSWRTG